MADDLGDEWWVDKDDSEAPDDEGDQVKGNKSKRDRKQGIAPKDELQKQQKNKNKRKAAEDGGKEQSDQKKRKKKKKKTLSDHLASAADKPGTADDLQVSIATHFHEKLSVVEMEDLILEENQFVDHNAGKESISAYLNRVVPDWPHVVKEEKMKKTPNKSCVVLVLTSSAKRAVDLNRDAGAFRGTCVTAKLFAKHIKMSEQEKFLASHRVQFAVGTPHRITSLIDSGAFTLDDTKLVILDWNWRDAKLRKLVDIPELKKDLFDLLRTRLVPAASQDKLRFGLF